MWWSRFVLPVFLFGALAAGNIDPTRYLIVSVPKDRQIGYFKLPSLVYSLLVLNGPISPKAICVDQTNARLFVSDAPSLKIFWYQLIVLPDGKLITDGQQHVAVEGVNPKWLTVDGAGNLYFTGKVIAPPPFVTTEAVFMHSAINIATGTTINPTEIWNRANSGQPSPAVFEPSGLATDNFHLYWGNSAGGTNYGSVVKGASTPPDVQPELSVGAVADNADSVRGLVLTPTNIFYSTPAGVYGISKNKVGKGCGTETCKLLSAQVRNPQGIVWDGDGTIYVANADVEKGAVFSFPSNGPLNKHTMVKLLDLAGVFGLDMLEVGEYGAPAPAPGNLRSSAMGLSSKVFYIALVLSLVVHH